MRELLLISIFLPLIPLLVGFIRSNTYSKIHQLVNLLLVVSIVSDVVNSFLLPFFDIGTLVGYHLFTAIEFTLYMLFFLQILYNIYVRKGLKWLILIFWLYKLLDVIVFTGTHHFDTIAITLEAIICMICCLYFFHQTLQQLQVQHLERFTPFWVCTGILIYFSGNLLLFLFSSYIFQQSYNFSLAHWSLHAFFSILKYTAFSIGLWWTYPTLKMSPS